MKAEILEYIKDELNIKIPKKFEFVEIEEKSSIIYHLGVIRFKIKKQYHVVLFSFKRPDLKATTAYVIFKESEGKFVLLDWLKSYKEMNEKVLG
jgi:hypothetical protein